MQYIRNVTTTQALIFSLPIDFTTSTNLVFMSYEHNFEVDCTSTTLNHFVRVVFSLTAEQAEYFNSGTTFKVTFGTAFDYVQGSVPSDQVIQYQNE